MLSNEKAMYQAYLIIENLPENEKKLISSEEIEKLKNNMDIDESIKINPEIDLKKQNIDEKTFKILNCIFKKSENTLENIIKNNNDNKTFIQIKSLKELLMENYILIERLDSFKVKNQNLKEYKDTLISFKKLFEGLKKEKESLLEKQQKIIKAYEEIPNSIKRIFLNDSKIKRLT